MAAPDAMRSMVEKLVRDLVPLQEMTVAAVPDAATVDLTFGEDPIEDVYCASSYNGRAAGDKVLVAKLPSGNWIVLCRSAGSDAAQEPAVAVPFGSRSAANPQNIQNVTVEDVGMGNDLGLSGGMTYGSAAFTVPIAGVYAVNGRVAWDLTAGGSRLMFLTRNGVSQARFGTASSATAVSNVGSLSMRLAAGDSVGMQCYQTSGGTVQTDITVNGVGLTVAYLGP